MGIPTCAGCGPMRGWSITARPATGRRTVIALAVEVQLSKEGDLYGIVVICETRALARKFAMPVMLGVGSSAITPKAIGPREIPVITSLQDGMADPGRLMLSAWYHSRRGPEPRESLVRLLVQVVEPLVGGPCGDTL